MSDNEERVQPIVVAPFDLRSLYAYFSQALIASGIGLWDFQSLGYSSIHDFFLVKLPSLFDEIMNHQDSDEYISLIDDLSNMGFRDPISMADYISQTLAMTTTEVLDFELRQRGRFYKTDRLYLFIEEDLILSAPSAKLCQYPNYY